MSVFFNSPLTGIAQPDNIGASGDYTIMCWVRINAAPVIGEYRTLFTRVDGTYTKWAGLFTRNDGNRRMYIKLSNGTTTVSSTGNFTYTTGLWVHVALTKGATGGFTFHANGLSVITANLDLSAVAFEEVLAGSDAVAAVSNLEVAYFREWNTKLTLEEVRLEMCLMTPQVKLANLVTDTTLDGHYNDATPNLNHWTPFGAATFTPQVTFPPNSSYLSAKLVPSLPYLDNMTANYSGVTFDLWYKVVAPYTGMMGAFAYGGDAKIYEPQTRVWGEAGGVPVSLPGNLTSYINAYNMPLQFPCEAGKTYFFHVDAPGTVPTADLRMEVYGFTNVRYPPGALMVPDDTSGFDGAVLSPTTGKVLNFVPRFPAGEEGDSLELREVVARDGSVSTGGGEILVQDDAAEGLKLYDKYLVLKIAIEDLSIPFLRDIQAHHSADPKFYLLYDSTAGFTGFLKTITVDGVWGPKTWTFPSAWFLSGVTVNQAQTIAYLSDSGGIIRRWDLINDVALPDFPVVSSNRFYILKNDHFVTALTTGASRNYSVVVSEYALDSTLLHTYTFDGMQAANVRPAADNPNSIWLWFFHETVGADGLISPMSGYSTFIRLRLSDGAHLEEATVPQYESGTLVPEPSSEPAERFGHSFSCPFYTLPAGSPPLPPPFVPGPVDGEVVPIRRLRQAPHLTDEHKVIRYNRFWLDLMTGIGTAEGQGQNPVVYLSWSDDGGKRWSNEYPLYAGKLGAYKWRAMRRRLGSGRDRIFRVTMSDPVDWVLIDAFIEIAKGTT